VTRVLREAMTPTGRKVFPPGETPEACKDPKEVRIVHGETPEAYTGSAGGKDPTRGNAGGVNGFYGEVSFGEKRQRWNRVLQGGFLRGGQHRRMLETGNDPTGEGGFALLDPRQTTSPMRGDRCAVGRRAWAPCNQGRLSVESWRGAEV
jgi:hypothetical protein